MKEVDKKDIISPLCIINCASNADLLYESLPCQSKMVLKCLNLVMEKSEARAAYLPSFPSIPSPTSACKIIPTSLPPSPMPATTFLVYFLMYLVT